MSDLKNAKTWSIFEGRLPWMADLANAAAGGGANMDVCDRTGKTCSSRLYPLFSFTRQGFFILTTKITSLTFTLEISEKSGNLKRI